METNPKKFDSLLLSEVRLGVISVLMSRNEATFTDLKKLLGLTQGNLGTHLKKLEAGGYVTIKKAFVGDKPRTTAAITKEGRQGFLDHVAQLQSLCDDPPEATD